MVSPGAATASMHACKRGYFLHRSTMCALDAFALGPMSWLVQELPDAEVGSTMYALDACELGPMSWLV